MTQESPSRVASATAPREVHFLLRCLGCGQNLKGLDMAGICPQCGIPIHRTLCNSRMMYAEPRWVARLFRGAKVLSAGMILAVLGVLALSFTLIALSNNPRLAGDIAVAVAGGVTLIHAAGVWMLTTFEPRGTRFPRPWWALLHGWSRFGAILEGLVALAALASIPVVFSDTQLTEQRNLTVGLFILMFVNAHLITLYFKRLALRVPDPRMARSMGVYLWSALGLGVVPLLAASRLFIPKVNYLVAMDLLEIITYLSAMVVVFLSCWWLLMLLQFTAALRRATSKAARFAATGAPPILPPISSTPPAPEPAAAAEVAGQAIPPQQ